MYYCVNKIRNNSNRITGYELRDAQGGARVWAADELKAAMKNGSVTVANLSLSTDNKIIGGDQNLLRAANVQAMALRAKHFGGRRF